MKKKLAIGKGGFKTAIAYRFHFFVSVVLVPLSLVIYYFLWKSIFEYSGEAVIRGFTFQEMISYYALSVIIGVFTWSTVDNWIENDVRFGNLVTVLLKPVNFFYWYYFFEVGTHLFGLITELIPIFIISFLFFGVGIAAFSNFVLFIISLLLAALLYFLISYIVGLTAFWFKRIFGIRRLKRVVVSFLSGAFIPLAFLPSSLEKVSRYLPFQYIRQEPIFIYLGK